MHKPTAVVDFSRRSPQKELLDRDDIPIDDIKRNMYELDVINTRLGGHAITISGMKAMLAAASRPRNSSWLICEIGCGGGDNLVAMHKWFSTKNITAGFIGIDINPDCIAVAAQKCKQLNCTFIAADYKTAVFAEKPDVIFSSLFCHHFTNEALVTMLQWMQVNTAHGFFINDLHRHPLAYYSIKLLTAFFSSSYLVKNDAPLSVLRSFTAGEWKGLLRSAGISKYTIQWKWAFRYLVTVHRSV